jgi:hypothetical protein
VHHYDCDVLTALGDSPEELELLDSSEPDEPALDSSLLSPASVLPLDSMLPLDSSSLAAASLDSPELELVDPLPLASPADSLPLEPLDPPLLPLVLDALCTDEVERAFEAADSAGSCPDASWT